MNEPINAISTIQLYYLLWAQHPEGKRPNTIQDYIIVLNDRRRAAHLPLLSSMSSFNPLLPSYITNTVNTDAAHALWQQGLVTYIKTKGEGGHASLLAACQRLSVLPEDHLIRMIGYCIMRVLLIPTHVQYFQAFMSCLTRFEHILHTAKTLIIPVPVENVLRDVLFYLNLLSPDPIPCIEETFALSEAWDENKPLQGLQKRIGYYAKQAMQALSVDDIEKTIHKEILLQWITPVQDGLLFLRSLPLRAQIETRYQKCPNPLLLISVPGQKLMAEFIRLAVYDRSPN